jgi:hypothetical protein
MSLRLIRSLFWSQRALILWLILVLSIAATWFCLNRDAIRNYLAHYNKRNELRDRLSRQDRELQELERQRDLLSENGFESEKAARQRFHMSKPGEKVLYLDLPPGQNDGPTTPTQNQSPPASPQ